MTGARSEVGLHIRDLARFTLRERLSFVADLFASAEDRAHLIPVLIEDAITLAVEGVRIH